MKSARKPGTCEVCSAPTSRTYRRRCKKHANLPAQDVPPTVSEPTAAFTVRHESDPPPSEARTFSDHGNGTADVRTSTRERVGGLEDAIRVCAVDTAVWEVVQHEIRTYEMGSKNAAGEPVVTPLCSVWLRLRKRTSVLAVRDEVRSILEHAAAILPPRPFVRREQTGHHMLEVMIPDLHLGKLAWAPETGYQHYDMRLAQHLFDEAIEALVHRTRHFNYERVVFPIGNDLFHSDTKAGTTTAGTPLDMDGRLPKMFTTGWKMVVGAIDRLRQLAPVDVITVPGNHDSVLAYALGDIVSAWFRNTDDVRVDNTPDPIKHVRYGQNLILFAHGNKGKLHKDYPLMMATKYKELWGQTSHREIHTGDKHQLQAAERMGVRTRIFSALCPPDAWHAENLFVGNERQADALVWHPEEGLIAQAAYVAPHM